MLAYDAGMERRTPAKSKRHAHNPRSDAKPVILAILEESGGFWTAETRLHKAFHVAHLLHWEHNAGALTTHPIVRMPHGPGIDQSALLLSELEVAKHIIVTSRPVGPYRESVYRLPIGVKSNASDDERSAVRRAIVWVGDKSATALSAITHEHSRTWQTTTDGERLDIDLDLMTDDEYERNRQRLQSAGEVVRGIFESIVARSPRQGSRSAGAPAGTRGRDLKRRAS